MKDEEEETIIINYLCMKKHKHDESSERSKDMSMCNSHILFSTRPLIKTHSISAFVLLANGIISCNFKHTQSLTSTETLKKQKMKQSWYILIGTVRGI